MEKTTSPAQESEISSSSVTNQDISSVSSVEDKSQKYQKLMLCFKIVGHQTIEMSISSFIYCVESLVYDHKYPQWETCFEKLALDPKPIGDFYTSGYGTQDYEIFIGYICMAYEDNLVPKACGNLVLITNRYGVKQEPVFPAIHNKEITTLPTRIKSAITMWMRKISMVASL